MATSFTVSLVSTAMDSISPAFNNSASSLRGYASQVRQVSDEVGKYNRQAAMIMVPLEETARQASTFEAVIKKIENSYLNAAEAQLALFNNTVKYQDILESCAMAAMYLAQTVEKASRVAINAISQIINMLQVVDSQLTKVVGNMDRAAVTSPAIHQNPQSNTKDTSEQNGGLFSKATLDRLMETKKKIDELSDLASFSANFINFMKKAANSVNGFMDTYKYFRQGAGIFRSLWSAISFGNPILTRVIAIATRFGNLLNWVGVQALINGIRMAAAWLIGLGPVGWIVGGVTVAVGLAIAAWRSNFLGFRDFIMGIVGKIVELINKVREALGMSAIELDGFKEKANLGDFRKLDNEKPPLLDASSPTNDQRQYNFNIQSNDPAEIGAFINRQSGGPIDKYEQSRDPRLVDPAWGLR